MTLGFIGKFHLIDVTLKVRLWWRWASTPTRHQPGAGLPESGAALSSAPARNTKPAQVAGFLLLVEQEHGRKVASSFFMRIYNHLCHIAGHR